MKIEFPRKTFVVIGRLKSMTKDEAWMRIENLGGWTSKTPRPSSDYIVVGQSPTEKKHNRAKEVGKPLLTEDEFLTALLAAEAVKKAERGEVAMNDALIGFRKLVYDQPTPTVWAKLTELLDQCPEEHLEMAVEYVEQHIGEWPNPAVGLHAPVLSQSDGFPKDVRRAPSAWVSELVQGQRSPKFRLVHRVDLSNMRIKSTVASRLTNHPDLINLRELDVGENNKLSMTFHKKLRLSEHLPALDTLVLRFMDEKVVKALCGEHKLDALRYVALRYAENYGNTEMYDALYGQLLEAPWWSQIEGLSCITTRGSSWVATHFSAWPALISRMKNLPMLRHLEVGDSHAAERLGEAGVFHKIERLTLYPYDAKVLGSKVLGFLGANPDHTIRVLDLSRVAYNLRPGRRRAAKTGQKKHKELLRELLQWSQPGALEEVWVFDTILTDDLRTELDTWAKEMGVAVTRVYGASLPTTHSAK